MSDEIYRKLADVLNTLPNGFPATGDGLEIRVLKKVFTPEEADLFCDLRLTMETPVQIAERTGRALEGLDELLTRMWREKGQIQGAELGPTRVFRMLPWIIGVWEMQVDRMDDEFARLSQEYYEHFGPEFFSRGPSLMRTIPVDETITPLQQALPYQRVSGIIEQGASFAVNDCVCKKEERILGNGCDYPLEVCLAISPIPGLFDRQPWGRPISKEEAYDVLRKAEEAGLVHMTSNIESGHSFICNCCGCCCGVLKGITKLGLKGVVNSDYYAEISAEDCNCCGVCAEAACQVDAIVYEDDAYHVDRERCIGCGLCINICPLDGILLEHKEEAEIIASPHDDMAWMEQRGEVRGVDFSQYK